MSTITATKAGNWSDTTVWDLGRIPANGDTVDLHGYVVNLDVATIPATGTLAGIVNMVGNWSAEKVNYYNTTQVNEINTSMQNYVGSVGNRWNLNYWQSLNLMAPIGHLQNSL